jgi:hypothetical protein
MAVATGVRHGDQGNAVITPTGNYGFAVFVVQVTKWDLDWPNDYYKTNIFGDGVKGDTFFRGMYAPTGTIEGFCQGIDFGLDAAAGVNAYDPGAVASAVLTLTERTNNTIAGSAHINIKIGVDRQTGLNKYTATFKGHGNWTETQV